MLSLTPLGGPALGTAAMNARERVLASSALVRPLPVLAHSSLAAGHLDRRLARLEP
jgi:hypothetical protein